MWESKKKPWYDMIICVLLFGIATGIGSFFQSNNYLRANIIMIYMVCVLLVASLTDGFIYGILESFLVMWAFNYFFVPPYYSLNVSNLSYIPAIIITLLMSVMTSMMTSKAKENERKAKEKERETTALLRLTNQVADARCMEEVAETVVRYAGSVMGCRMACMITDDKGRMDDKFLLQEESGELLWKETEEKEQLEKDFSGLICPEYRDGLQYRDFPIYGQKGLLGAIRIPIDEVKRMKPGQIKMFASVRETTRLAMDRLCVLKQQMQDNAVMERERYRSTILRSISHDLRTPLAGIMGTSEILLDMVSDQTEKRKLLEDISRDAQWLYELVENVLSLTKLNDGALIHKEPEACEEVVESAIRKIQGRTAERKIEVIVPQDCLVIAMDAKLIQQVLVNILDNAVKNTPEDGTISILVRKQEEEAVFEIMDNGSGIRKDDFPYIFRLFYTAHENKKIRKGVGLGLAICESIIKAHGGRIYAANREDGSGAIFRFTIPIGEVSLGKDNNGY